MDQKTEQTTVQPDAATTTPASDQQQEKVDFKSLIPAEYKDEKALQNFNDMNGFVKSYLNANRMVGLDKIPVPNKHATDDDWNEVYKRLGKPETADEYKFNLPKETKLDENSLKAYKEQAHKLGLLPHQADGIIQYYNELANSADMDTNSKAETARLEAEQTLRKEFGPAYSNKLKAARQLASATLGEDFLDNTLLKNGSKVGDDPTVVKAFAELAGKLSEDTIVKGDSPSYMTVKEIEQQLQKIQQPGSAYWDKTHPNHSAAVQEAFKLQELKQNG